MPERSNGAVSKTVDPRKEVPGFESLSLRRSIRKQAVNQVFAACFVFIAGFRVSDFISQIQTTADLPKSP